MIQPERVLCVNVPLFTGVCPALVTPFHQSGTIDFETFGHQIDRQIHGGAGAVCVCGTTGEASTLSVDEHLDAIEFCVRHTRGRVPVIAGTGSNDTAETLFLTRRAGELGADAALVITPYYNKTSQAGLIRHYETVAEGSDIPLILYHVPGRTGQLIAPDTYRLLSGHSRIIGVKEASGDLALVTGIRRLCGDGFYIWSGNDDQTVPMMALGAKGVISVASNLMPERMVQLVRLCLSGEYEAASKLQVEYAGLIRALFSEVNPIPIKAAMALAGLDSGRLRLPLWELSQEGKERLRREMKALGLITV